MIWLRAELTNLLKIIVEEVTVFVLLSKAMFVCLFVAAVDGAHMHRGNKACVDG